MRVLPRLAQPLASLPGPSDLSRAVGFPVPPCPSPLTVRPRFGYGLADLLAVQPPPEPADFASFWHARYRHALSVVPGPRLQACADALPGFRVQDLAYQSTDAFPVRDWLLTPLSHPPLPQRSHHCRATPTECLPDFLNPLSSISRQLFAVRP
jgi:hypothetical protein